MELFTVALFGHRNIDDLRMLERAIVPILKKLLSEKDYVEFYIGRNGEFDEYIASVIKRIKKISEKENSSLILALPYMIKNVEYYEKYYDQVIIPEVCNSYPKGAIIKRNKWMIEHSNLVICYVKQETGGAYSAFKYAKKLKKETINLAFEGDEKDEWY